MSNIFSHKSIYQKPGRHSRLIYFILFCTVFLNCFPVALAAPDALIVKVGIYENEPKIFTSPEGRPSGIFIDIIEFIARNEGWNLEYVPGTWSEGLQSLAEGEIDLMPDVAYTAQRAKILNFHKTPVMSSWFQAYARKGSGIQSILDLKGKRIALLEKSFQEEAFIRFSEGFGLNMSLITVPDYKTMFEIVASGQADAAITNQFYGIRHARKYGLVDTAVVFEPSVLFFATTKGTNEKLLKAIDRHLTTMKKDSQSIYYRTLKRWTSEEVGFQFPFWVQIFGLVSVIILLISLGGSLILKRQINARTLELQKINREMEQRVVDRTAELAKAMEKAKEADRLKSAFLATMSHELRTPLNSIIGFTGILLRKLVGPLNNEQVKQLGMVSNSARHLLELINDVLDISKIEAGQAKVIYEKFNLPASIEKIVKTVFPLAEKKNLKINVAINVKTEAIESDQRRVEQILLNLLNNAIKFTEKGSVSVKCEDAGGQIIISVADTGIGIREEDLGILFNAFQQIDSGITRKYEGTGLGLSICKKLSELLGGEIKVTSIWGKGSTFSFVLPRHRTPPAPAE